MATGLDGWGSFVAKRSASLVYLPGGGSSWRKSIGIRFQKVFSKNMNFSWKTGSRTTLSDSEPWVKSNLALQ